jgi:lipoprotein LprG
MRSRLRTKQVLAIAMATGLLLIAGCGGSDSSNDTPPEDRLAAAKTSLDDADFIGFTLGTDDLPSGVDGLVNAEGTGTHEPAFTGKVDVQASIAINANLIAVNDTVWAELPIFGWKEIDPADYGAPDPAALMDTDSGISSLFTATEDLQQGDDVRHDSEVFSTIEGTIPGEAVKAVFPSAGTEPFDVSYRLNGDDEIAGITITGPFYGDSGDVTYDLTFDLDADAVEIQPPG